MSCRLIIGLRRFTCLSPTLVRVEYALDGRFEDRTSIVAAAVQQPMSFISQRTEGPWQVLVTAGMEIWTRDNHQPANRLNLELRWQDGRLQQLWRPGDPDYQNLGGTLRSLDRYGGESCRLDGVQVAGMASPDPSATNWPAWLQCEVDPLYNDLHPAPPANLNKGHWLREAQQPRQDGRYQERTFNWYKDARRFSPGILSASGYFLLNDSESAVYDADGFPIERQRPGSQDWYFFAYAKNYRQALRDFRLLSGPAPLPTHRALGIVFSRWPAFTQAEVSDMARDFAAHGYPLATLVMDMEWHQEGWGHWEFNPELIPDPAAFFALCQSHGLEVVFNDHPLDIREDDKHFEPYLAAAGAAVEVRTRDYNGKKLRMAKVDITDKQQNQAFHRLCQRPILDLGLDYWWNDGSRGQLSGTCGQLVCNQTSFAASEREGKRGMLFARYGGLGSHRYGAFFTGDASSDWEVLRLQVEFNIRAAGVGLGQVSHDIGGFMLPKSQLQKNAAGQDIISPERYLRWLQFGVFGPLLRFHSAPGCGSRLPYAYDGAIGAACRHWLRVRHALLPYIYTTAWEYRETGIPPTRPLFLEHPHDPLAYVWDQYYFGPALLVAPVTNESGERQVYLPPGLWWAYGTGKTCEGGQTLTRQVPLAEVPVFVRAGSIIPCRNPDGDLHSGHIGDLHLQVYAGAAGTGDLYEDDGRSTAYREGGYCHTHYTLTASDDGWVLSGQLAAGRPLGTTRKITVTLSSPSPLLGARLAGGQAVQFTALPEGGQWQLSLPEMAADQAFTIYFQCAK
jgi:alpha-glucosidase (family GH31 glycosyl hydrolase)